MKINTIVTVRNHENYIAQYLEGILKQKDDFQLEVIAGDDCSTDNIRRIIEEFQKKNPKVISVLKKNLRITKNLKRCLNACSGEHIAICEADDYWTDENKLHKQKSFLGTRKDCSMCFSAILLYYKEYVREYIQNILNQTFQDFEIIITDTGLDLKVLWG